MEAGTSNPPTASAADNLDHDDDSRSRNIEDEVAQGPTDSNASGAALERASSGQDLLETGRRLGPLHSYHRGTAVRMLTDYLSDLRTLNLSLDEDLRKRVEENQAFLKELREANERDPNSPLTWQERTKLSEMLKDYQSAVSALGELEDEDDDAPGVDDVEFKVEKGVAGGVPLQLYEAKDSGGEYVRSLASALDLCEAHIREFKKLLLVVRVFPRQCKNLVETLEPSAASNFARCHKVLNVLKRLEAQGNGVPSSSQRNSVHFCFESLIGLARRFHLVDHLVRKCACASENLHKTALQLADLPPPPLMSKRWSEFSLAIRNCEWSMDIVEFAFCTLEKLLAGATLIFQDVSFKWCEEKCRMVLQIQGKPGIQDSRLDRSMVDLNRELKTEELNDLTHELRHIGESANGTKWKLSGILSRAAFHRANVSNFLSEKLSGPIPHARYLPWTFRVDTSTLKFREYLDSGGAGMVGKYSWYGENVAVKNVRSQGLTRRKFEEEAAILATVQHPNVVRLIGCGFIDKNKTGQLVMELMDHDLRTVIETRVQELGPGSSPFSVIVAIDIILQIAQAMKHLKDHKVLHRDLKAKNVLVNIIKPLSSDGESNTSLMHRPNVPTVLPHTQENYVAKLADFGLAKCRPHSSWVRTRMAGTTGWRAPEVFHVHDTEVTQEYNWPADVYSFAMTCYEILTGNLPFANVTNQSIHEHVMANRRPEGLDELDIPDLLKELVKNCWATDPDERPTFDDIVKSLWECRVKAIVPIFERHITVSRSPSSLSAKH